MVITPEHVLTQELSSILDNATSIDIVKPKLRVDNKEFKDSVIRVSVADIEVMLFHNDLRLRIDDHKVVYIDLPFVIHSQQCIMLSCNNPVSVSLYS